MKSLTLFIFTVFGFCFIWLAISNTYSRNLQSRAINSFSEFSADDIMPIKEKKYSFTNPTFAYKILTQLDVGEQPTINLTKSRLGVKHSNNYCEDNRAYFIEHPESVFEEINFVSTAYPQLLIRKKALQAIGNEVHPEVGDHMSESQRQNPIAFLKPEVNLFYIKYSLYFNLTIGSHFSCLSQISNHIPGRGPLDTKDLVAKSAITYGKRFEGKPHCFNHDKIFPKTWVLQEKESCEDFFKILNSPQYQKLKEERKIVYISKIAVGSHRGEGVQTVRDEEEAELRAIYGNGTKCGKERERRIVQDYIHNPLLLNGHKFDFRMYMLIASTNPLIAYYHDGFLRVTLFAYDINSNEKTVLLTNIMLNNQIYDEVRKGSLHEGMDEEEMRLAQHWSFDRLQAYLLENGIITDPNWFDNYLRPEFKKAMIHLLRMSSYSFGKHSSLYELYGVDFMLDDNLNLWFIEANSYPSFGGYSVPIENFVVKMLKDHFEIVIGLLRSRMKRVMDFVNALIESGEFKETVKGELIIYNLEEKRAAFIEITKNYFEREFEPSYENGFSLIINENLEEGVQRYQGLIAEECL